MDQQQQTEERRTMAISFLVNPEDQELSFPWMQRQPSMSSPPSSPSSSLLLDNDNDYDDNYQVDAEPSSTTSSSSSSPSGSFSYSSSSYPSSPSSHINLFPLLPSFATIASAATPFYLSPQSPPSSSSSSTSMPTSTSTPSASPSSPSSSYAPSPSASSTVAELLEGLIHTMGPHAFANHATSSSSSSTSPASVAMKESRGRGKGRRQASAGQVSLLEEVFALEPIPTALTKARLSQLLDMPTKRIQIWFKNKRARQKKGRSRKEPFTFHYFAAAAAAAAHQQFQLGGGLVATNKHNSNTAAGLNRFRPVKPSSTNFGGLVY